MSGLECSRMLADKGTSTAWKCNVFTILEKCSFCLIGVWSGVEGCWNGF